MSEFVDYLHEVFSQFGPIHSRKMFGGYGIYHQDLMFALVADDVLYLKGDQETIPIFEDNGMEPFRYEQKGKVGIMRYYSAPEDIYDDPDAACHWAGLAFDAAVRANSVKLQKARNKKARKKR